MTIKTLISKQNFIEILDLYDIGKLTDAKAIKQGTVQTNYHIKTTHGEFIFRYYENRSKESVLFESDLLCFLIQHHYPCPELIENHSGVFVGFYVDKPYTISKFITGKHIRKTTNHHKQQLIQKAAELQTLGKSFYSPHMDSRWNYSASLCQSLARAEAEKTDSKEAFLKLDWLEKQLSTLELPESHPKGVCHGDFHFSNVLFQNDQLTALIDFDDANITYLTFDLVSLIDAWAWKYPSKKLNLSQARTIVQTYEKYRPLTAIEKQHLMDVHKLCIFFDCVWFFQRGSVDNFYERKKIEFLDRLGREGYSKSFFCQ